MSRPLDTARAAVARGAWREAFDAYRAAERGEQVPAGDAWQLAMAAYLIGEETEFEQALEAAHGRFLASDDPRPAARCAFWLGLHYSSTGRMALGSGWFARTTRALEIVGPDCAEHGYTQLPIIFQRFAEKDWNAVDQLSSALVETAEQYGDSDLLVLGLNVRGRALLRLGRVPEGLGLMDETMIVVLGGGLSPTVVGSMFCSVIGACREVSAWGRARDWSQALTDWCERQPDMVAYSGECRAFQAEVLQRRGELRAAIDEALRIYERFAEGDRPGSEGFALYQLGEAHRLLGELAEAEDAYRRASQAGREPQPGLALLRLAQGDLKAASAAIGRAILEAQDPFRRSELLPAYVEVMIATGRLDEAEQACLELERLVVSGAEGVLDVVAAQARGSVLLAKGRAADALPLLREAWTGWRRLGVPYEAARARVMLGHACRALGDEDSAKLELDGARAEMARIGVPFTGELAVESGPPAAPHHRLTKRELEVLALVARGLTNKAIAKDLFISEKTVARHVANIFGKLEVNSRTAAAARAFETGVIAPST